jgi:Xaa-Pro aminopeptidase
VGADIVPSMDIDVFSRRRAALARRMQAAGGGIALIPTAPEQLRNGDVDHPYRFDSHFHYLTGFAEPAAWLVLRADGHSTLFCQPKDPERELWDGLRLGPQAAVQALGVHEAHPLSDLDVWMLPQLAAESTVWLSVGLHACVHARLDNWLAKLRTKARSGVVCPAVQRDLSPLLAEMRLFKDDSELAHMRRAAQISAGAHVRAMRFCAERLRAGAGEVREYEIEAELLHEFRRHGSSGPAYTSIVAAGANACVLHYAAADALLRAGDLCLIDAGCEVQGYASDVTRTFPASGVFSSPQRDLYAVVQAAQEAAIAATRHGARHKDAHHAAVRVLAQGMLDFKLLDANQVGQLDDVIESQAYRQFYMHGTGHWLGRDVHDVGDYVERSEALGDSFIGMDAQGKERTPPSRLLQPGMVLTIEPGLYVRPAPGVPGCYWNIGIRIEDDAVVTDQGCELISRGVPVRADEIEALMRG